MTRIVIVTNVLPNYRQAFYQKLLRHFGDDLTVFCQRHITGMNLSTVHHDFITNVRLIRCASFPREYFSWQFLPFRELMTRQDIYFFSGNPRVLSTVLLATLLMILGRKVVIWGQLHTAGANPVLEFLRLRWWRQFKYLLLYNDREVQQLRDLGFSRQILLGMNNGLDQKKIDVEKTRWSPENLLGWQRERGLEDKLMLLSCARLDPKNHFEQVIDALPTIITRYPNILWVVIGDGSERKILQHRAKTAGVDAHVRWLGALHDEAALCPWFLSSALFVHPAAIGLSLLHAFGYGLPVITHSNARGQMPEFNVMPSSNFQHCYRENDIGDLASKILDLLDTPAARQRVSADVLEVTRTHNIDCMVSRFIEMVQQCTYSQAGLDTASRKPYQ